MDPRKNCLIISFYQGIKTTLSFRVHTTLQISYGVLTVQCVSIGNEKYPSRNWSTWYCDHQGVIRDDLEDSLRELRQEITAFYAIKR